MFFHWVLVCFIRWILYLLSPSDVGFRHVKSVYRAAARVLSIMLLFDIVHYGAQWSVSNVIPWCPSRHQQTVQVCCSPCERPWHFKSPPPTARLPWRRTPAPSLHGPPMCDVIVTLMSPVSCPPVSASSDQLFDDRAAPSSAARVNERTVQRSVGGEQVRQYTADGSQRANWISPHWSRLSRYYVHQPHPHPIPTKIS